MAQARRLQTDKLLMDEASGIVFNCPRNTTILWSGDSNRLLAKQFCDQHAAGGYMTLEMLLQRDHQRFFDKLKFLPWAQSEEIWYLLSAKLAESATGAVRVFAAGIVAPEDSDTGPVQVDRYKSAHPPREGSKATYCNSVFEKVEGPALDGNMQADPILLMGRNINAKPKPY